MLDITWKPVTGYEESYLVSNTGLVKSRNRCITCKDHINRRLLERTITQHINNYGYASVKLSAKGETKTCFVHRLVAEAFIPNPDNLPEVNHKSGIKTDNAPSNLEWVTHQENVIHAYKQGLSKNQKGNHRMAIGVIDNSIGQRFETIKEWAAARNMNYSTGRNILSGCNHSKIIDLSKIVLVNKVKDNLNG